MKYVYLNILLFLPFWVVGQNCTIYVERDLALYKSIQNPILINVEGQKKCSGFYVTVDNGKIESRECKYSIIPEKIGEVTISVFKNNGKLIDKKIFRVEELILEAYVLGKPNQTKNYIDNVAAFTYASGLSTMHKDIDCWDWDNRNLNYELIITKTNDQIIRFKSLVNSFSDEMRNEFRKLQSGDILLFHTITLNKTPVKHLMLKVQ